MYNKITRRTKHQTFGTNVRLLQDIKELHMERLPGIEVFFKDTNIRLMCVVLTPQEGK